MKLKNNTKGSVALISILIISSVLIFLAVGMSNGNISTSSQYLNSYTDQTTYHLAEACLEESILRLEDSTDYAGGTINFTTGSCTSTITGVDPKDINIVATYDAYTQRYHGQITIITNGQANNASLSSWEKI